MVGCACLSGECRQELASQTPTWVGYRGITDTIVFDREPPPPVPHMEEHRYRTASVVRKGIFAGIRDGFVQIETYGDRLLP